MTCFVWSVWKMCRLVGYVKAYSSWEAQRKAEEEFGRQIFIVRFSSLGSEISEESRREASVASCFSSENYI